MAPTNFALEDPREDLIPFKEWLKQKSYPNTVLGPPNLPIHYSTEPMIKVDECLKTKAKRLICVYGEYNPWSASAARIEINLNTLKVYAAKGSHGSRISSLNKDQKVTIITKLHEWLGLPIPVKD